MLMPIRLATCSRTSNPTSPNAQDSPRHLPFVSACVENLACDQGDGGADPVAITDTVKHSELGRIGEDSDSGTDLGADLGTHTVPLACTFVDDASAHVSVAGASISRASEDYDAHGVGGHGSHLADIQCFDICGGDNMVPFITGAAPVTDFTRY